LGRGAPRIVPNGKSMGYGKRGGGEETRKLVGGKTAPVRKIRDGPPVGGR